MKIELDPNASDPAGLDDFSDAVSLTVAEVVPVAPNAAALTVTPPEVDVGAIALTDTVERFKKERDSFVAHHKGMIINSPSDLEYAGTVIDTCISTKKQVDGVFKVAVDYFFRIHRSLTGLRGELNAPFDALEKTLRDGSVAYRQRVAEDERRARQEADRQARLRAEAAAAEERAAANRAAAEAAEAAAAAKAIADAAAAAGDLDAAMEAEAHAQSAETQAAAAATEAAAVESAPVYAPPAVMPEPVLARNAGGSTLVDNWVATPLDSEEETVNAIVAACAEKPALRRLLCVDEAAVKRLVKALKNEAVIPGMRVDNKPIDRRLGARGK